MSRLLSIVTALLIVVVSTTTALAAERRVALVVGNSTYQHASRLANPSNDAADIAAALKNLEFYVIEGRDLDKAALDSILRRFARELTGAHVGLFFYAGHALQVDGQNYLVPIDAKLEDASGLDFELVRLDLLQRTMERATKTNLLFLDACRDNPLTRNLARALGTRSTAVGRGLAATESGEGTLISYSTQPGNVSLDGVGRNSPFAGALLRRLIAPGNDDLSAILIAVRNQVMQETSRRQVPWEHSALTARFYFVPPSTSDKQQDEAIAKDIGAKWDGTWEIDGVGKEGCAIKKWVGRLQFRIADGVLTSLTRGFPMSGGRISEAGEYRFTVPAYVERSVTMEHAGQLSNTVGQGTYRSVIGSCEGTTTLKKIQSPPQ